MTKEKTSKYAKIRTNSTINTEQSDIEQPNTIMLGYMEFKRYVDEYQEFYYFDNKNCLMVYGHELVENASLIGKVHYYKDQEDKDLFYMLYATVLGIDSSISVTARYYKDLGAMGICATVLVFLKRGSTIDINKEYSFLETSGFVSKSGFSPQSGRLMLY